MSTAIRVPEALAEKVSDFIRAEGLACRIVREGSATVEVIDSADRAPSTPTTLRAGGWIACPDALSAAARLQIPIRSLGKLLDTLDIRIRECQLGCF